MAKLLRKTWEIQMADGNTFGLDFDNHHTYKLVDGRKVQIVDWWSGGAFLVQPEQGNPELVSPERFVHWVKAAERQAEFDEAVKAAKKS